MHGNGTELLKNNRFTLFFSHTFHMDETNEHDKPKKKLEKHFNPKMKESGLDELFEKFFVRKIEQGVLLPRTI